MPPQAELKVNWCSEKAVRYACQNWHYSRCAPVHPYNAVGIWEDGIFVGCVVFSHGAAKHLGAPYGLSVFETCELTRVALRKHSTPVSRLIKIALKFLKHRSPGIRLVVSFADPYHGHHGGIYQAGNWIYTGTTNNTFLYKDIKSGRIYHSRAVGAKGVVLHFHKIQRTPKRSECQKIFQPGKHRYLMPLDEEIRQRIEPLRKPYPRKCAGSIGSDASADQVEEGVAERPRRSTKARR